MGKRKIIREGNKEEILASVTEEVCKRIRTLGVGAEVAICEIVRDIYLERGYEFKHADGQHGWVWTRDGCETYSLQDSDQFIVLDQVIKELNNEFRFDFTKYKGLVVGLPYNIPFIVRAKKTTNDPFLEGVVAGILNGRRDIYNPTVFYGDAFELDEIISMLTQKYEAMHPQRNIVQITGEEFAHILILCIKDGTHLDFGKQFDNTDLLVFEDVQEIAGKNATMQQFYGVFDKVYESGGQIVVTSSEPPSRIHTLDDRIKTQLEGGMICEVRAQDA